MTVLSRKPGGSGGGGAPSGPAGGDLTGTYPNPTIGAGVLLFDAFALLRDQRAAGTNGGSSAAATWNVRPLQTEVSDIQAITSIAANRFTLQAGTYLIQAWSTVTDATGVGLCPVRLRDITAGATAIAGGSWYQSVGGVISYPCTVQGVVSPAGATVYEVQHYTQVAEANIGLGTPANLGEVEVYAEVLIWRLAA